MPLSVHRQGTGRTEHRSPLDLVQRCADVRGRRQKDEILDVQNSGRLVGALQGPPKAREMPWLSMRHGRVGQSHKKMTGQFRLAEKFLRRTQSSLRRVAGREVELVDLLPHLRRDDLTHRSGVFARRTNARKYRVWILAVESEELQHVLEGRLLVTLGKLVVVAR